MGKTIFIKLTVAGKKAGPFDIIDDKGVLVGKNISKQSLIIGTRLIVDDSVNTLTLKNVGKCSHARTKDIEVLSTYEYDRLVFTEVNSNSLWTHLVDHSLYNSYYNNTEPYIIEYPFSYQGKDEIVQSVSEHAKVFRYIDNDPNNKIKTDREWFNKAVLYNDSQSSGILHLHARPVNNMQEYLSFPKFNNNSKSIIWTKTDNMYNYNTFWSLVKNKFKPLFLSTCDSLSLDKEVNNDNMDYSVRAFRKHTLRGKDLKVRHILDDKSHIKIVTQFILTPSMISHK